MKFYDTDTHEIFEASAFEFHSAIDSYNEQWLRDTLIYGSAPVTFTPSGPVLKGHYHWIYKLDEEYVMIKFEDKYVHFRWTDELKGKKVFFADSISNLEEAVTDSANRGELIEDNESGDYPFRVKAKQGESTTVWRFVYCDPNYDCKIAFNEGKQIQFKSLVDDTWRDCDNMGGLWLDTYEYRIKPSKPALKWTDLKLGDIIKKGDRTAMVTDIVADEDTDRHIYAGCCWFTNDFLKEWEKVEA